MMIINEINNIIKCEYYLNIINDHLIYS